MHPSSKPPVRHVPVRWLLAWMVGAVGSVVAIVAAPLGCGSSTETPVGSDAGTDGEKDAKEPPPKPIVETLHPDADPLPGETECEVVITTNIYIGGATHVPTCTPVEYATNPPSGGDHWAFWAAYGQYSEPVPREVYVHNMEHGAVILAYRCESECPEVVGMLEQVMADVTPDKSCIGFNARIVLTPDPELDTPVAAAAWGATYTATCLDPLSLAEFVKERYARGPEDTCAQGTPIDMLDGGVACER